MSTAEPSLCVIAPDKDRYSETFIHAHALSLFPNAEFLSGGGNAFPTTLSDDSPLLKNGSFTRLYRKKFLRLFGLPNNYFEMKALRRFLIHKKIDAVLAEYGPTAAAVMDVCESAGVPLIAHFHGYDANDLVTLNEMKELYPKLFKKASAIVVVSRDMEKKLLSLGASREKLFYNSCGVDTKVFNGADPASAPIQFLAVARIVDKKGPFLTILAFQKVLALFPDARLIFVGDGALKEASQQLAAALGMGGSIQFLGVLGQEAIVPLMRSSRAYVQHSIRTSYGDTEGTPVGILEAASAGLPVVSTYHAGIPDVITDGEEGFLVPERDIDAMADRMSRLAKDPELAKRMGGAARKKIEAHYSREGSFGGLRKIIEAAVLEKRK